MLKAWSIRSKADLFDWLSTGASRGVQQLVNADGARLEITADANQPTLARHKWLVSVTRPHGSKHTLEVTQTLDGLHCHIVRGTK